MSKNAQNHLCPMRYAHFPTGNINNANNNGGYDYRGFGSGNGSNGKERINPSNRQAIYASLNSRIVPGFFDFASFSA